MNRSQKQRFLKILLVRKEGKDEEFNQISSYLKERNHGIVVPCASLSGTTKAKEEAINNVDMIITLGGDGTVLRTSSLFRKGVPPILSFNLGTLGFLPAFEFSRFKSVLGELLPNIPKLKNTTAADCGDSSLLSFDQTVPFSILNRMRLSCSLANSKFNEKVESDFQIMNEVAVHRGHNVQLGHIDTYINDNYLTDAVADGLVVSTPTGSTAYSLSAGGPIVHPRVPSMILTPICPRSLSFRSMVLPPQVIIRMKLSDKARGDAFVSADGKNIFRLAPGYILQIQQSPYSIPCIQSGNTEWLNGVVNQLKWNQSFKNANM